MIASAQVEAEVPSHPDVELGQKLREMIGGIPVRHAAPSINMSLTTERLLNRGGIIVEKNMSGRAATTGLSMDGDKDGKETINAGDRKTGEVTVIGTVKSGNHAKVPTKAVVVAKDVGKDSPIGVLGGSSPNVTNATMHLMQIKHGDAGVPTTTLRRLLTALAKPQRQQPTQLLLLTLPSQSPLLEVTTSTRTSGPRQFTMPCPTLTECWQSMKLGLLKKFSRSRSRRAATEHSSQALSCPHHGSCRAR